VISRIEHYRILRRDIAFLRHIVEACEGLAFVRTVDPRAGVVAVHVPPGRETEAGELMRGLAKVLALEPLSAADAGEGVHG